MWGNYLYMDGKNKYFEKSCYYVIMKQEVVIKDNKIYIALFLEIDTRHETPIYLIEIKLVNDSDFEFLRKVVKA